MIHKLIPTLASSNFELTASNFELTASNFELTVSQVSDFELTASNFGLTDKPSHQQSRQWMGLPKKMPPKKGPVPPANVSVKVVVNF